MCDPQINEPNNNEVKVDYNKKPDIEMGYKVETIPKTGESQVKGIVFDRRTMYLMKSKV